MRAPKEAFSWGGTTLRLVFGHSSSGPVRLAAIELPDGVRTDFPRAQNLVEVQIAGEARDRSGTRYLHSRVGSRLRYVSHTILEENGWHRLTILSRDASTALEVESRFDMPEGGTAFRSSTRVINRSSEAIVVHSLSSFSGILVPEPEHAEDWTLHVGRNEWLAESRWVGENLRDRLPDISLDRVGHDPRGLVRYANHGSQSSIAHLPMGALTSSTGRAYLWQIEHNGAWQWELSERVDGFLVGIFGPTDAQHQWAVELQPGEGFDSVPAAIAISDEGFDGAAAALTTYRRAIRRPHPDTALLPVIFNDYMNTLQGDPTTAKLLPLIDAAAEAGADYFCIDAGWYDEDADWWDSVGTWLPSRTRFPNGLGEVTDQIKARGMVPGIWLEPEVIGIRSTAAADLPDDAFLQRSGRRQIEDKRFHLDLRSPAALRHLDDTVDRLIADFGIGFFKFDYNINAGPGTDHNAFSVGAGLLEHNRALLAWLDSLYDRHPDLIIENCASGGMRADYAMLQRMQLQSTSDQQDFRLYPAIAASAPLMVLPEQSGSWAYPQPEMTAEEIAFSMITGMLGRLYLSGHLDRMSEAQMALTAEGVRIHKDIRHSLTTSTPFWPCGLSSWNDEVLALGLRNPSSSFIAVWSRSSGGIEPVDLLLPHLIGREVAVETLYPAHLERWFVSWDSRTGRLRVTPRSPGHSARLFEVSAHD